MSTNRLLHMLIVGLINLGILLTACSPQAGSAPTATPDPKQALVGSWTATVTKQDILRVVPDFLQEDLCDNAGTFVWRFNADETFAINQTPLPECPTPANTHIEDKWSIDGNLFTIAKGTPDQEIYEFAIKGNQLTFKTKSSKCIPCIAVNTANPWTRVE